MTSNVVGTLNILESCKNSKIIKFLYSASSSCYGITKKHPTKEDEKINPMYPYALTKKLGEDLIIHWSKVYANTTSLLDFLMFMEQDLEHQERMVQCLEFFLLKKLQESHYDCWIWKSNKRLYICYGYS